MAVANKLTAKINRFSGARKIEGRIGARIRIGMRWVSGG